MFHFSRAREKVASAARRMRDGNKDEVMKAHVKVTLKNGVLDPQGKAIEGALSSMGFDGVNGVRQGKYFEIELAETDKAKAEAQVKAMCEKLIANMVIENYVIELG
jgi:phosphoribosylformylglycinamidine synthase subunit PurS